MMFADVEKYNASWCLRLFDDDDEKEGVGGTREKVEFVQKSMMMFENV